MIEREPRVAGEVINRRFRIAKRDVQTNGPTEQCRGCMAALRGGIPVNHSAKCRERFEKAFIDQGDARLLRQAERFAEKEDEEEEN